jgi:hypothetical protein
LIGDTGAGPAKLSFALLLPLLVALYNIDVDEPAAEETGCLWRSWSRDSWDYK